MLEIIQSLIMDIAATCLIEEELRLPQTRKSVTYFTDSFHLSPIPWQECKAKEIERGNGERYEHQPHPHDKCEVFKH